MQKIGSFLFKELLQALPAFVFFFLAFHLSMIIRHLDDESVGISLDGSGRATIAALVLGKIYLVLDRRSFTNRYSHLPLVFGALWKTLIYDFFATLAIALDELLPALFKASNIHELLLHLQSGFSPSRAIASQLILIFCIFLFSAMTELSRALGPGRFIQLFLGLRVPWER